MAMIIDERVAGGRPTRPIEHSLRLHPGRWARRMFAVIGMSVHLH